MLSTREAVNYAFTCIFVVEAALKLTGLGWEKYWKSGWNRFDLLLVASGVADMLVALIGGAQVGALKIQKVMRLMRLARVVKLVRGAKVRRGQGGSRSVAEREDTKQCTQLARPEACAEGVTNAVLPRNRPPRTQGVRSLFGTLIVSLPAFWNVGALLGLLFYIYAYIGEGLEALASLALRQPGLGAHRLECTRTVAACSSAAGGPRRPSQARYCWARSSGATISTSTPTLSASGCPS